jgi:hypothetical protein
MFTQPLILVKGKKCYSSRVLAYDLSTYDGAILVINQVLKLLDFGGLMSVMLQFSCMLIRDD